MNLFSKFIIKLNETNIKYAIVGDTEKYPEIIESDVDIVINYSDLSDFWIFLKSLRKEYLFLVQKISHESTAHYCIIKFQNLNYHEILKPDICTNYVRNGKLFILSNHLLKNRKYNSKGYYQLSNSKEFLYYILKKIDKGYINKQQFKHLKKNWKLSHKQINKELRLFFSIKSIKKINTNLSNDLVFTKYDLKFLKIDLHRHLKYKIKYILSHLINKFKRIITPTGLVVAFMGPDGSGKTTAINTLNENVIEAFRNIKFFHLYPNSYKKTDIALNPQKEMNRGKILSVLKLVYITFIYLYGYLLRVIPLKIKSHLIVFDRYYHDHYIDKRRYRYGSSDLWLNIFSLFIPKPDVWILLDASVDVVQSRKKEVSCQETERQIKKYKKMFKNLKNAYIVDSNQNIKKVQFDIEKIIFKVLEKKIEKRLYN